MVQQQPPVERKAISPRQRASGSIVEKAVRAVPVFRRTFQRAAILDPHGLPDFEVGILANQRQPLRIFGTVQLQHVRLDFLQGFRCGFWL